ncbi:hypothetical protein [Streptomyces sp. NPDC006997]|uniref:hypothetical protein n=1 Tax=Streptomyces sp. NPDC006997 TaxID=3155356 RepID=UPI003406BBF8
MSEKVLGLAAMVHDHREVFLRQLRFLKKGAGLTPESAGGGTLRFLRYFGVTTALEAYELLRASLNAMDASHLYVQALLNAYGGEGLAGDIKTRRKNFAEQHGLTEARVFHLEDLALDEMVEILDALAQGKEIKRRTPEVTESSVEEPSIRALLVSLIEATQEQTAVLREISTKLDGW